LRLPRSGERPNARVLATIVRGRELGRVIADGDDTPRSKLTGRGIAV
jgi:hypothetical protein